MDKYVQTLNVENFQCDPDGKLRFGVLFNILQKIADYSANQLGFGYDFCLQKQLGWVGANYHLKIKIVIVMKIYLLTMMIY